jgi:hypothetical protein
VGVLLLVAAGVYLKQSRYDRAVWTVSPTGWTPRDAPPRKGTGPQALAEFLPPSLRPMGPFESFGPATLSDKIDGKAELYLPAGFVHLTVRRFVSAGESSDWLEVFVYDMGDVRNAFAVYSAQRRSTASPFSLTPYGYRTKNALFLVHGKYYLELVASSPSDPIMAAAEAFAGRFVEKTPQPEYRIAALDLFPPEGLDAENRSFIVSDAFGFQGLNNVFIAPYRLEAGELTAFLTERSDEDEAQRLVEAYRTFLIQNGGEAHEPAFLPGGVLVRLFGTVELFFSCGPYLVGLHQAEAEKPAEALILRLKTHLGSRCM